MSNESIFLAKGHIKNSHKRSKNKVFPKNTIIKQQRRVGEERENTGLTMESLMLQKLWNYGYAVISWPKKIIDKEDINH